MELANVYTGIASSELNFAPGHRPIEFQNNIGLSIA